MALTIASHESTRIKLLLVSLAIIMIGITFAFIPVAATVVDASVTNLPVASRATVNLGPALNGYVINAYLSAVGTYILTINNIDAGGNVNTLFTYAVNNAPFTMPPVTNYYPGTIQVKVTSAGGSSATLDASLQHSTTTYPLQIPGLALLVAGAALILTRVYRVKVSVSPSMPIQ